MFVLCTVHQTMVPRVARLVRASAVDDCADFQIFSRKIARISIEKLRNFGAERARDMRETCAETAEMLCTLCGIRLQLLRSFGRRRARLARKSCAEIHRNFRDFTRKTQDFGVECAAKRTGRLRK